MISGREGASASTRMDQMNITLPTLPILSYRFGEPFDKVKERRSAQRFRSLCD